MIDVLVWIVIALVIAGLVAPNEALRWWRHGDIDEDPIRWPTLAEAFAHPGAMPDEPVPEVLPDEAGHYVVYLSGIGISTPDQLPVVEIPMVEHLAGRLGDTRTIWQIYPYSVENTALTQGRMLSWFWTAATRWKFHKTRLRYVATLINLRNAFQMLVSSDDRYGPVFNLAIARQVAAALIREGYVPEHRRPVTLLGWSGGAQVAAGVAWYLAGLGMDVRVMSMAGIISADPGLERAVKVWHLRGDADHVERAGRLLFAGRWRRIDSPWNRALADGRLKIIDLGPLTHTGAYGYYSGRTMLPDGRTPRQVTADTIVDLLASEKLAVDKGGGWDS